MFNPRKLAEYARGQVSKQFNPGKTEQCMAFVRSCLDAVDAPVKYSVTKKAVDGLDTGYYLASSLAGKDLGYELVGMDKMNVGSVVFFNDTYEGWWPKGTITHVGIYVGSGLFVHRPTVSKPVMMDNLYSGYWHEQFRCGLDLLRPVGKDVTSGNTVEENKSPNLNRLKISAHSGKVRVFSNGEEVESSALKIFVNDGKIGAVVNGVEVDVAGLGFDMGYRDKAK